MEQDKKETTIYRELGFRSLLPFIVFVIFYFGFAIATKDFSKVPMTVAFLISSATALALNTREKLGTKLEVFAQGMGHKDIMIMCLIFILAGAFTATSKAVGGIDSVVKIACHIIPPNLTTAGLFITSALISLAVGTSCGTIAAIVPIAVSLSQALGLNPAVLIGATVGGAMFGDNLSLISDTTIASTRSQNVEMKDKMICNFKIVAIPAILCASIYMLPMFSHATGNAHLESIGFDNIIKILPYILLLIFGILGVNVMFLLLAGTAFNIITGVCYKIFDIFTGFIYIGDGTVEMATTIIVAMLAGGLLILVKSHGGITYIITETGKRIKDKKSCEIGICFLVGITNLFTANNTVAIITSGGIAKELSKKYDVSPQRTASLLDITSCCVQGIIPYGAQILIATSLASSVAVSSFAIMQYMFYPILMIFGLGFSILFTANKK